MNERRVGSSPSCTANAESVALNLASESGRPELRRLLLAADVVIEGSCPRALEQMSLDAQRTSHFVPPAVARF